MGTRNSACATYDRAPRPDVFLGREAHRPVSFGNVHSLHLAGFTAHKELVMIKARYATLAALALLFVSASLHAQSGCVDSPEAPTDVLMLVGFVGMFYGSSALMKVFRRNGKR